MIPLIKKVKPLSGYRLYVEMSSGSKLEVDFSIRIETMRFYPLKDIALFESVTIDPEGSFLLFGDKLKLGASELMEIALTPQKSMMGEE